jgi:hypothetical protein
MAPRLEKTFGANQEELLRLQAKLDQQDMRVRSRVSEDARIEDLAPQCRSDDVAAGRKGRAARNRRRVITPQPENGGKSQVENRGESLLLTFTVSLQSILLRT